MMTENRKADFDASLMCRHCGAGIIDHRWTADGDYCIDWETHLPETMEEYHARCLKPYDFEEAKESDN